MHPASVISYYPTYSILDEAVSYKNYKTMNLYIDLKNVMQTLYMKHAVETIVENSLKSEYVDTSLLLSLLSFLSFNKLYSIKRQINVNFIIFFEVGRSYYHQNISKKYKVSRRIDDLYGLDREKRDLFYEVVQKNLMLIERIGNKLPNVKVIRMSNLEADFIPYYLLKNKLVDVSNDTVHIVFSNDHDLYQSIINDNVLIFSKTQYSKKLIKCSQVMNTCWKLNREFPDCYLPLSMSIIGDGGDDVDGIENIGSKRMAEIIEEVCSLTGGLNKLYDNVFTGNDIFDITSHQNKYINKIVQEEIKNKVISNNLKLVSFEMITRAIDDPINTEMVRRKNEILEIMSNNSIAPLEPMRKALAMNRVFIDDDSLDVIYYKRENG